MHKKNGFQTDSSVMITDLVIDSYSIPTHEPESDGTFEWEKTIIILVRIFAGGQTGLGYTYGDLSTAVFIRENLKPVALGQDVFSSTLWDEMRMKCRNLGIPGIGSMAVSAVDIALWDLRGKILGLPVYVLAGKHKNRIAAYGSGGFTSYTNARLGKQFEKWLSEGISMFKMKIGREKEKDDSRIRYARDIIGEANHLFVDANGAYFPREACMFASVFDKYKISWFEEPVSSDDLKGLAFVRSHVPSRINVAAGEYGYDTYYFKNMLDAGAVDILQADATRCGGITGFLKASVLCEAYNIPLSAHTAPSVHVQACCAASKSVHLEYFHDHIRIEEKFFDGFIRPSQGFLAPDPSRPGLGLEFKEKDAAAYLITK